MAAVAVILLWRALLFSAAATASRFHSEHARTTRCVCSTASYKAACLARTWFDNASATVLNSRGTCAASNRANLPLSRRPSCQ